MKIEDKQKIWSLIEKYDSYLNHLTDSLSKILQNSAGSSDYKAIFSNYRLMEMNDVKILDSILGEKILLSLF